MIGPHHLAHFNTVPDNNFDTDEVVYRRCPTTNQNPPYERSNLFLEMNWNDIINGVSTNRSRYANNDDTLWADSENEGRICTYLYREGIVFKSLARLYPTSKDNNTGVAFVLIHTPKNCNVSHCDINAQYLPDKPEKHIRRDIRAYLSSFFS